jgi:hypothetical protein
MFAMSFHLPHYVLRRPLADIRDVRTTTRGSIRRCHDVSFLNLGRLDTPWLLYEAQASCVLSGFDEWCNVAWYWLDTYFDGEKGDSVQKCFRDEQKNPGFIRPDPFTRGTSDAKMPERDCRGFFLAILIARLSQICQEWEAIAKAIQLSIRAYEEVRRKPFEIQTPDRCCRSIIGSDPSPSACGPIGVPAIQFYPHGRQVECCFSKCQRRRRCGR